MSNFKCKTCGAIHIDSEKGYISYCNCSKNPRTGNLFIIIKSEWFEKIKSGEKTSEYREIKPYWNTRLNRPFETVTFAVGYRPDREIMTYKIISIGITTEPNDLNLARAYEIKLGEYIS